MVRSLASVKAARSTITAQSQACGQQFLISQNACVYVWHCSNHPSLYSLQSVHIDGTPTGKLINPERKLTRSTTPRASANACAKVSSDCT